MGHDRETAAAPGGGSCRGAGPVPVVSESTLSLRERSSVPDLVGAAVLVGCAVWAMVSAAGRPARPEGVLLALLAVAAGYAAGRISGALLPMAAPAVAAAGATAAVVALPDGLSGELSAPPLGYSHANAALLTLAAGAACCAAWACRSAVSRTVLRLLALAIAVLSLAIGSFTGCAAALGVLLASLAAARMRRRALSLAGLALCSLLAVGMTVAVAEDVLPGSQALAPHLSETRVALWSDAVHLARDEPLRGVGPGRFGDLSPVAATEARTPKAYSAALQQAAEQGLPGAALLAGAYLWMLFALWRSPRPTPVVLTAGAALTGIAVQASIDYILSYAAVTAGSGLLAGFATAHPTADDPPVEYAEDHASVSPPPWNPTG